MRRAFAILASLVGAAGCAANRGATRGIAPISAADWAGVYAMPAGAGGAAQILSIVLPDGVTDRPLYRMVIGDAGGAIDVVGAGRIDGDTISLAIATAALDESAEATRAVASVERYHFRRVSGRAVLISDEALAALGTDDASTIAGLLIKVSDRAVLPEPRGESDARPIADRREWSREGVKVAKEDAKKAQVPKRR